MAKRKPIDGKDLMLFIGGKTIALATSCTLNLDRAANDTSSKDDGDYEHNTPGAKSWNISTDALYSANEADANNQMAYDELFDAWENGTDLTVVFGIVSNASSDGLPSDGWKAPTAGARTGVAHVTSLSLTGSKGSTGSMAVSLVGSGKLSKMQS